MVIGDALECHSTLTGSCLVIVTGYPNMNAQLSTLAPPGPKIVAASPAPLRVIMI